MMCDGVYQSVRCWEFSELCTTPCQILTVPHLQIGSRPIHKRIVAAAITTKNTKANEVHEDVLFNTKPSCLFKWVVCFVYFVFFVARIYTPVFR